MITNWNEIDPTPMTDEVGMIGDEENPPANKAPVLEDVASDHILDHEFVGHKV